MELEALQGINSEVRALGAQIVVLLNLNGIRQTLHKKLSLSFDIPTDLRLKTAEEFRLVFTLPDYLRDLYESSATPWTGSTMSRSTDCRYPHDT